MSEPLSLAFKAVLPELEKLNDAVDAFALRQAWAPDTLFHIKLALEEIVINVINYGADGGEVAAIKVQLQQQSEQIIIDIREQGTTVLLVEQNAAQALKIADKAYILETGEVVRTGTGSELAADDSVRAAYLGGDV